MTVRCWQSTGSFRFVEEGGAILGLSGGSVEDNSGRTFSLLYTRLVGGIDILGGKGNFGEVSERGVCGDSFSLPDLRRDGLGASFVLNMRAGRTFRGRTPGRPRRIGKFPDFACPLKFLPPGTSGWDWYAKIGD